MDRVIGVRATHTLLAIAFSEGERRLSLEDKVLIASLSNPTSPDDRLYTIRELLESARALDSEGC